MKAAPTLPPTPKYPEFVYPAAVPATGPQAAAVDRGWRYLQGDDLRNAEREFAAALKAVPDYVPARTGEGYIAMARQDYMRALDQFELALRGAPAYAPALVGKGQALLYRELGMVERRQGDAAAALEQFNRAVALDPADAVSFAQAGEILEERGDFAGAETAYRNAANVDRFAGYDRKAEAVATRARDASLPAEFRALASADRITRGDLAALIGIRLEDALRAAPATPVVTTDTAGHWAALWIAQVVATGVIPAFDNHTFQPETALRRVDLAEAASALLRLMARTRPALQARLAARPTVSDMSPSHLNYPAVAAAVSAGVLPLLDDGRFDIERPVAGAEAIAAIDRLRALGESR